MKIYELRLFERAHLSIVSIFLMDLIKADTLSVEVRIKGAKRKIILKCFHSYEQFWRRGD